MSPVNVFLCARGHFRKEYPEMPPERVDDAARQLALHFEAVQQNAPMRAHRFFPNDDRKSSEYSARASTAGTFLAEQGYIHDQDGWRLTEKSMHLISNS